MGLLNHLKSDGTIDRYEVSLVAQGYKKEHGLDYEDPFLLMVVTMTVSRNRRTHDIVL